MSGSIEIRIAFFIGINGWDSGSTELKHDCRCKGAFQSSQANSTIAPSVTGSYFVMGSIKRGNRPMKDEEQGMRNDPAVENATPSFATPSFETLPFSDTAVWQLAKSSTPALPACLGHETKAAISRRKHCR